MRNPVVLGAIAVAVVLCLACAGIALVAGGFIAFSDGWFGVDSVSEAGRPTPIQVGSPIIGTIENILDANAYSFRAQEGVRYVIETDPEGTSSLLFPLGDSLVGVWDESGENLLTFNDDYAVCGDARPRSHQDRVTDLECGYGNSLGGAVRIEPLGYGGNQLGKRSQGAPRLAQRTHLLPVAEKHDDDQGRNFPPELDLE